MNASANAPRGASRRRPLWIAFGAIVMALLGALAVLRGGLLDLPAPPREVTAQQAGLANAPELANRAAQLAAFALGHAVSSMPPDSAFAAVASGLAVMRQGDGERGLALMRRGLKLAPNDLVLGNAFRMEIFRERRRHLSQGSTRTSLVARVPPWLEGEPITTLERLNAAHPSREATLQLALGWVDELLLFGALEIKAPASVESVELLTALLQREPSYIPGLYGRGLNYLHRPSRLEWPEAQKAAPDAASRDLGMCVAIGRRVGGASPELVATLAMTLGDAYAKEGRADRARSWWQIAANACREPWLLEATRRRFGWQNDSMLDQLEAELEARMLDLDHPLTDLSIMWR